MNTVRSSDGTEIAFDRTGNGPPLVLVHGSLNDHNAWAAVAPLFAERFTVFAMDRRGRGGSGRPAEHALEREFEDVVAVMVAAGDKVDLVGHSFGAHCALGAAVLAPDRVKHLVLYEPPTQAQVVAPWFEQTEPSEAVAKFFRENVGVPRDQVEALRASPFWAYFVAHAPSYPPEMRALAAHSVNHEGLRNLTMPAMLLAGSDTREQLGAMLREIEPLLSDTRWHTLEGQGHAAMRMAPTLFAEAVMDFLLH
jgi:pimeloyl-ACP methyl ester carboxylesterase